MKKWDIVNYYVKVGGDLTKAIKFLESKEFEGMRIEDGIIVIPSGGTDRIENKQMKEMIINFMFEYINLKEFDDAHKYYTFKVWIKKSGRN